jgi:uroporphyrinogen decarboxylase
MNSKRRILTALNNGQPDRVPIIEAIDDVIILAIGQILGFDTGGSQGEMYCTFIEEMGLDATISAVSDGREPFGNNLVRNRDGLIFRLSEQGEAVIVDGPIKESSDLRGYDLKKPSFDDFAATQHIVERVGSEKAHFVSVTDPFKAGWLLRGGMEIYLMDYVLNPQLVHDMARIATDHNLAVIELAAQMGVDGFFMGGDLASEQTTLMSPRHYREYIKPYQTELVDYAHQHGLKFIKHTDGNMWPILDDFIEVGFDAFHPVQPQCMDIRQVKKHLAGKMCVIGNIDCRDLLSWGTEEEVEETVKATIAEAAPGGGYIISSSNSIHPGVKPENYIAMVRAAHEHGVYGVT